MNYHMYSRRPARLLVVLLLAALVTACAGERSPSPEERQAAAAATIAAARATEAAAAQIQAELTRAAIPSATPLPMDTSLPTETPTLPASTPSPTTTGSIAASKDIIAADGGSIELSDGTRLEIPPSALPKDGEVTIARLDVLPPEAGDLDGLQYQAYEITAPTHSLEVSATVTFSYQDLPMDEALAPDAVFAAYWDGQNWQGLASTVNPARKTLSVTTDHFSILSIFLSPPAQIIAEHYWSLFAACMAQSEEARISVEELDTMVRQIASSHLDVKSYPVYQVENFGNFAMRNQKEIAVDLKWFANESSWLPTGKSRLLLKIAILSHELAHGNENVDNLQNILDAMAQVAARETVGDRLFRKELSEYIAGAWTAFLNKDCSALSKALGSMLALSLTCWVPNQKELFADNIGVKWAAEYAADKGVGNKAEVGLIFSHWFERLAISTSCSHPSSELRMRQIASALSLGPEGGIYGKVTPALVEISVDGKAQGVADENGQFLITGIAPGIRNIQFSRAGFQTQTLSIDVPPQRLKDITEKPPISLQPMSLTPIPITTAKLVPTPKATLALTPIPTRRPGLITDFETWGTWTRGEENWGTFTQSKEQVSGGSYSGKFTYNFPVDPNNYLVYRQTIPIAGQPTALKIMVYGDGSGNFLNTWVQDANGQLWQFTFGQIYHTGWQQMGAALDVSRGWPNQAVGGNPKTAAPVYPLRFYALVLDGYREDAPLQGAVYVDDLLAGAADVLVPIPVTPPTPNTATSTAAPTNNASIAFRADLTSLNAGECTTLRWDVDNVTAVYLDGQGVGGHESRQVCPTAAQTYNLNVTRQDGSQQQASVTIQVAGVAATPTPTSPPPPIAPVGPCEAIPGESYDTLSIEGSPSDRPAESHADLNLGMRGYERNSAALQFSDYGPAVDPNGPQLPGLFADNRTPGFTSTYQVYDWDWGCNCRAGLLNQWEVTLLGMAVNSGEPIRVPDSGRSIGSGYEVLVLYASPDRITLKYTPVDNVVSGYTMHIEDVCVEPNLLGLYQSLNQSGRGRLPALRAGQAFGRAKSGEIKVAIRDGGAFFDPRSRQDWWRGR